MENKNPYLRFQISAEIQSTKITSEIMIKDRNGKKRKYEINRTSTLLQSEGSMQCPTQ